MRKAFLVLVLALAACSDGGGSGNIDTGLEDLTITRVDPGQLVPGTRMIIVGSSFVDDDWGQASLHLVGDMDGQAVDVAVPASFVDYGSMRVAWPGGTAAGLPADDGTFSGEATLEVRSVVDDQVYVSPALQVTLDVASALTPTIDDISGGQIFVNDQIVVSGTGFLLGGDEGLSVAHVEGCFQLGSSGPCLPVEPVDIAAVPATPFDRSQIIFPFSPRIAGIFAGHFEGMVTIYDEHGLGGSGAMTTSGVAPTILDVAEPKITGFSPPRASLGQYVDIAGGGFVGGDADDPSQITLLRLNGVFTPDGGASNDITLLLIPEFESGRLVRYVVAEDDDLGQRVDLRTIQGDFSGTATIQVRYGLDQVDSTPVPVSLGINHVRQVVWINFLSSYVESLRHFGLRGADTLVRNRVLEVARRDYATINMDFRIEQPTDFAYYAQVDIAGPDVNGLGLLGYDNSPGKDVGNERLTDHIGGKNAQTLDDGSPGFGGVFVESFFALSEHPGKFADMVDGADPRFDRIFDPFRPDRGGRSVTGTEAASITVPASTAGCLDAGNDRNTKIGCAVRVLGSMIGTTMTHEVGHSLGLANPQDTENFHDAGDRPNRLMDGGGARSFTERAELDGDGPSVFCDTEYEYLREILPTDDPPTTIERPPCD
jgi:hypothetical protein